MPGPLPDENARRRNDPTIPTTSLPAKGYDGFRPPAPPNLGPAGAAFWEWAWTTPQAAAWDIGVLSALGRRARLEDDLRIIDTAPDLFADLPDPNDSKALHKWMVSVEQAMRLLQRMVAGEVTVMREMRELEDRLGLNPKAAAGLRWKFVGDREDPQQALDLGEDDEVALRRTAREERLRAARN